MPRYMLFVSCTRAAIGTCTLQFDSSSMVPLLRIFYLHLQTPLASITIFFNNFINLEFQSVWCLFVPDVILRPEADAWLKCSTSAVLESCSWMWMWLFVHQSPCSDYSPLCSALSMCVCVRLEHLLLCTSDCSLVSTRPPVHCVPPPHQHRSVNTLRGNSLFEGKYTSRVEDIFPTRQAAMYA